MRHKSRRPGSPQNATPEGSSASERLVRDIRRVTRKDYSAEDKIRIVLDGLGKRRLAGDKARAATTSEVKDLKRQALELKEVVAEQALELRLLKKSMTGDGGDEA